MSRELIVEERTFPQGGARTGTVELEMASGEIWLAGGASQFADGTFRFSHPELRPEIEYEVDDGEAELEISSPHVAGLHDTRVEWDLRLNSDVDLELAIEAASAAVDLDFAAVTLTGLDVQTASGDLRAAFGGRYPGLDEITIGLKSGNCDIDLAGAFEQLDRVDVKLTSGNARLAFAGEYQALERVTVDATSGNVDLDLRGHWPDGDVGVTVDATSGNVTVRVPEDVGLSLGARTQAGMISTDGFTSREGRLVNAAFENSATTIWLNIRLTSGMIHVS